MKISDGCFSLMNEMCFFLQGAFLLMLLLLLYNLLLDGMQMMMKTTTTTTTTMGYGTGLGRVKSPCTKEE